MRWPVRILLEGAMRRRVWPFWASAGRRDGGAFSVLNGPVLFRCSWGVSGKWFRQMGLFAVLATWVVLDQEEQCCD